MTVFLIAGLPASGKDTLAEIIAKEKSNLELLSLSSQLLKPLLEDKLFREEIEELNKISLNSIDFSKYNSNQRSSLVTFADELNFTLKKNSNYSHFVDLVYAKYGTNIIIPSFREKEMLTYLKTHPIKHKTILLTCNKNERFRRWIQRDKLSLEQLNLEDKLELKKYYLPLLEDINFDYRIDNSNDLKSLKQKTKINIK